MTTIYDFNPTAAEIKKYGLGISKEKYLSVITEPSANSTIAYMLWNRHDDGCYTFADKLPPDMKADFYRITNHP